MQAFFQKFIAFFLSILAWMGIIKPKEAKPVELTVMTFNVQHFENMNTCEIDYGSYADFIRESGAAVVGLNEVFEDQLAYIADELGWESFFAPGCIIGGRRYGNAIVSKLPLIEPQAVTVPDPEFPAYDGYYETRVLLKCGVEAQGKRINVICTHFGLNPDEAENAVRSVLENIKDERQILMGDLNLQPDDPLLDPIREKMRDTSPLLGDNCLTFPSDAPDRKLDYVFLSRDLTAVSADIPELILSDHRPYRCTVMIP
ncbi:MAG: endonuclease/exonuclease/phosphatase family protein [Clostridia bacterium]|nr:endonuclease/exonuclease/phosphatase family protein [Clostridia bacterium]